MLNEVSVSVTWKDKSKAEDKKMITKSNERSESKQDVELALENLLASVA